jgi:hypothetical protein
MLKKCILICNLLLLTAATHAQIDNKFQGVQQFKDTIYNFVFDSLNNDLGIVEPVNKNNRLAKKFIYIGDTPVFIVGQKSGDPHFICEYPKEPMVKGKIYSFTVCFWFEGGVGVFDKLMSLELSDGRSIFFKFKGHYKNQ